MTLDDLEKEIIAIKKKGLPHILEQSEVSKVRGAFYNDYIEEELRRVSLILHRNIELLVKLHKTWPSVNNIEEYVGMKIPQGYSKFISDRGVLYNIRFAIMISIYYGVPLEILLFTDLTANEELTKKKYPVIFGKTVR